MSIFSDYRALSELKKLKKGEIANLSMSQIVNAIINLSDAKKNLSQEQYKNVYMLYREYRKCNTKLQLTMNGYLNIAIKLIKSFDRIAPYEKYSGGNELEFSFMMQDIRSEVNSQNIKEELNNLVDMYGDSNDENINYFVENGKISWDNAKAFVGILISYDRYGKEEAIRRFKLYVDYLINAAGENYGRKLEPRGTVAVLCGALAANNILSKDESNLLSKHYSDMFNANLLSGQKCQFEK